MLRLRTTRLLLRRRRTVTDEQLARLFHETYEHLAPHFAYQTRKASAVSWNDVPEPNKSLMIAVARVVNLTLADD